MMALPNVHINEVPEQGLTLTAVVQPEELELSVDEGRFHGPLSLEVDVQPVDQGLSTHGILRGCVIRECVRCLVEYEESMDVPFSAQYRMVQQPKRGRQRMPLETVSPVPPSEVGGEEDQGDDDIDRYTLAGERLDLSGMLREQVILSSPMHPLCREDCLGLCPTCGENRNQGLCDCREQPDVSPFAALRKLQQNQSSGTAGATGDPGKSSKASRN